MPLAPPSGSPAPAESSPSYDTEPFPAATSGEPAEFDTVVPIAVVREGVQAAIRLLILPPSENQNNTLIYGAFSQTGSVSPSIAQIEGIHQNFESPGTHLG